MGSLARPKEPTTGLAQLIARPAVEPDRDRIDKLLLDLSMAHGLDEIMAVVRTGARSIVGCDGITFVLREGDKVHYADEDAISPLWKGQRFPADTCISGWAMMHREVVVIEDIYADDRITHTAYRPTFVKSLVMTPVRRDDPVAAIGAYWSRKQRPSRGQLAALKRIANTTAAAMTTVELMAQLEFARLEAVRAKDAIVFAMASLAETRDNETGNHIHRTQHYVRALAKGARKTFAELDELTIDLLFETAPLHDIGKVGIPDRILLKPGKLTSEEYAIMQGHADLGRNAIAAAEKAIGPSPFLTLAREIAHTHHERWDGAGYPRGIKGDDIPLAGRIMAIADVYDAIVSKRVYKPAMMHEAAVTIIGEESGRQFDPRLVQAFLAVAHEFDAINKQFADA